MGRGAREGPESLQTPSTHPPRTDRHRCSFTLCPYSHLLSCGCRPRPPQLVNFSPAPSTHPVYTGTLIQMYTSLHTHKHTHSHTQTPHPQQHTQIQQKSKKHTLKNTHMEFPLWLTGLRSQHSVHEDAGSVCGLTRWVKALALPQTAAQITDAAWIPRCCGCGVGWQP